jgi:hypothetical protein
MILAGIVAVLLAVESRSLLVASAPTPRCCAAWRGRRAP